MINHTSHVSHKLYASHAKANHASDILKKHFYMLIMHHPSHRSHVHILEMTKSEKGHELTE